jgi:hypothetical protein
MAKANDKFQNATCTRVDKAEARIIFIIILTHKFILLTLTLTLTLNQPLTLGNDDPESVGPGSGPPGHDKEQGFAGPESDGPGSVVIQYSTGK